jgi:hypothetical protein
MQQIFQTCPSWDARNVHLSPKGAAVQLGLAALAALCAALPLLHTPMKLKAALRAACDLLARQYTSCRCA